MRMMSMDADGWITNLITLLEGNLFLLQVIDSEVVESRMWKREKWEERERELGRKK